MTLPITSQNHLTPEYQKPTLDSSAKQHLFIAEEAALPMLQPLLKTVEQKNKNSLVVTDLDISPVTTPAYQLVPRGKTNAYTRAFLLANAKESAVYIAGTESFLWNIHKLVLKSGIDKSNIHMLSPISNLRRVICTHCFTIMDNVSGGLTTCSSCQRQLEVQDQFSEVHGAYAATAIRLPEKPDNDLF